MSRGSLDGELMVRPPCDHPLPAGLMPPHCGKWMLTGWDKVSGLTWGRTLPIPISGSWACLVSV